MIQSSVTPRKLQDQSVSKLMQLINRIQNCPKTQESKSQGADTLIIKNSHKRNQSNGTKVKETSPEQVRQEYQIYQAEQDQLRKIQKNLSFLSPLDRRKAFLKAQDQLKTIEMDGQFSQKKYISIVSSLVVKEPRNPLSTKKLLTLDDDRSDSISKDLQSQYIKITGRPPELIRKNETIDVSPKLTERSKVNKRFKSFLNQPFSPRPTTIIRLPTLKSFPEYLNYFEINNLINLSNNLYVKNRYFEENKHQQTYKLYTDKGNNMDYFKSLLRNRPYWVIASSKSDSDVNLIFTQKKKEWFLRSFPQMFEKSTPRKAEIVEPYHSFSVVSESFGTALKKEYDKKVFFKYESLSQPLLNIPNEIPTLENTNLMKIHNHIDGAEFLDSKKELLLILRKKYPNQIFMPRSYLMPEETKKFEQEITATDVWIVKPAENTNRGQGIKSKHQVIIKKVMKNLRDILNFVRSEQVCFVVQKYITNPFLYQGRKFDIRCFVLITLVNNRKKAYWYKHGYVRTSSRVFDMRNLDQMTVHLTNDAIQNKNQDYGKFEKGNKLSLDQFDEYLKSQNQPKDMPFIFEEFKDLATKSIYASIDQLSTRYQPCFEVYGLDFMLDEDLNPFLIEFNTNPCYEMTCPVLQKVIGRMLQNVVRLVIDPLFPASGVSSMNIQRFKQDNFLQTNSFELIVEQ